MNERKRYRVGGWGSRVHAMGETPREAMEVIASYHRDPMYTDVTEAVRHEAGFTIHVFTLWAQEAVVGTVEVHED